MVGLADSGGVTSSGLAGRLAPGSGIGAGRSGAVSGTLTEELGRSARLTEG